MRTLYRTAEPGKSIDLDTLDESEEVDAEGLQALIEAKFEADIKAKLADEDKTRAAAALLDALKDTETVFGAGWKVSATTTHRSASLVNYPATTQPARIQTQAQGNLVALASVLGFDVVLRKQRPAAGKRKP